LLAVDRVSGRWRSIACGRQPADAIGNSADFQDRIDLRRNALELPAGFKIAEEGLQVGVAHEGVSMVRWGSVACRRSIGEREVRSCAVWRTYEVRSDVMSVEDSGGGSGSMMVTSKRR